MNIVFAHQISAFYKIKIRFFGVLPVSCRRGQWLSAIKPELLWLARITSKPWVSQFNPWLESAYLVSSYLGVPNLSPLSGLESMQPNSAGQDLACLRFRKNTLYGSGPCSFKGFPEASQPKGICESLPCAFIFLYSHLYSIAHKKILILLGTRVSWNL
jgi:hypothetical protein